MPAPWGFFSQCGAGRRPGAKHISTDTPVKGSLKMGVLRRDLKPEGISFRDSPKAH